MSFSLSNKEFLWPGFSLESCKEKGAPQVFHYLPPPPLASTQKLMLLAHAPEHPGWLIFPCYLQDLLTFEAAIASEKQPAHCSSQISPPS